MATVPEQLRQLAELLKEGLLTREQFEEQRDQLLADDRARRAAGSSAPEMLTEVGAYHLLGVIGEGGMGVVYRGRHRSVTLAERQGGDVAVKVMHPQYARNTEYKTRFEHEAALGLKLAHPGVVKVHDLVLDGGNLALVMDYVDGRALTESIGGAAGPIPWKRACALLDQLLDAVGHAHDRGVVHRDLKPDNILMTSDGVPHVIDFGIAKDLGNSRTRTGTGMGTVEYMAPEQYTDAKAIDRRADVYSLGMILYEMLAGRLPWEADAPQFRILEQKANKQLKSPHAFCPGIPGPIVKALAPTLAADPGERPESVGAFREALREAVAEAEAPPAVAPQPVAEPEAETAAPPQSPAPKVSEQVTPVSTPKRVETGAPPAVAEIGDRVIVERHRRGVVIAVVHGNLKVEFDDGRLPRTKLVPPGSLERETAATESPPSGDAAPSSKKPAVQSVPPASMAPGLPQVEGVTGRRLRVGGDREARLLDVVHGNLRVEFVDGPGPRVQLVPPSAGIEFLDGPPPRALRSIFGRPKSPASPLPRVIHPRAEEEGGEDVLSEEPVSWTTALGFLVLTIAAAVLLLVFLLNAYG